jgi:hypothetical protein
MPLEKHRKKPSEKTPSEKQKNRKTPSENRKKI